VVFEHVEGKPFFSSLSSAAHRSWLNHTGYFLLIYANHGGFRAPPNQRLWATFRRSEEDVEGYEHDKGGP
jgi:hypothetical protein